MYLLAAAERIACKDASLFGAFSCSWAPPSTFYKLLSIERIAIHAIVYPKLASAPTLRS